MARPAEDPRGSKTWIFTSMSSAVTRIRSPALRRVPVTITSTSASFAILSRSGSSPANREAIRLDRTTKDSRPVKELVTASGTLVGDKVHVRIGAEHAKVGGLIRSLQIRAFSFWGRKFSPQENQRNSKHFFLTQLLRVCIFLCSTLYWEPA